MGSAVYPARLSAHARKVIDMKVRDAAALVGAVTVSGALLAGCSSGPTPQGVADSYLAAWAHRDWPAMRALVASPPADFAAVNAAALADLGAKQARYRPGHLAVTGNTSHEPVTEQITLVRRRDQFVSMSRFSEGSAFDRSGVTRALGYLAGSPPVPWLLKEARSSSFAI